jgi:hypothetical protein
MAFIFSNNVKPMLCRSFIDFSKITHNRIDHQNNESKDDSDLFTVAPFIYSVCFHKIRSVTFANVFHLLM